MSDQVDAAIGRAADNPLGFAIIEGATRRVLCRRFPYAVFFEMDGDRLFVLAVTHVRRDPIVASEEDARHVLIGPEGAMACDVTGRWQVSDTCLYSF